MIDFSRHISPFESTHTDAEIAVYCNTLCSRPLKCADIRTLCAAAGVIKVDESQRYIGPLVDFLFSSELSAPMQTVAKWFFQHCWMDQADTLSLDGVSQVPGVDGFRVVYGFGVLSQAAQQNAAFVPLLESLVELAGGFVYQQSLTEADIAAAREAHAAEAALEVSKQALVDAGAARWNAFVAAVEVWDGTGSGPEL